MREAVLERIYRAQMGLDLGEKTIEEATLVILHNLSSLRALTLQVIQLIRKWRHGFVRRH